MRFVTVIGARPQFIKAATISRVVAETDDLEEILLHTGQHFDANMSKIFFDELNIPKPDYNLEIGSGPHGAQTGKMLAGIEEIVIKEKPDFLLVYGDTNSTMAGALAAVKLGVPVVHVEAGFRVENPFMPEQINRVVTDHISDVLFAASQQSVINLRKEGLAEEKIHFVGDVMYDATLFYSSMATEKSDILQQLGLNSGEYILSTVHRAETTDNPKRMKAVCGALMALARDRQVILPLHPRTRKTLEATGDLAALEEKVTIIEPVGFLDMIALEKGACFIATDSGGVQREAFFQKTPAVLLRRDTEIPELNDCGWVHLANPDLGDDLAKFVSDCLEKGAPADHPDDILGDGKAAQKIIDYMCNRWRPPEL